MRIKKNRFFEEDEDKMIDDIAEEGVEEDVFDDEDSMSETPLIDEDMMEFSPEDEEYDDEEFEDEDVFSSDEEEFENDMEEEEFEDDMEEEFENDMEEEEFESVSGELDSIINNIEYDIDRLKNVQDEVEELE